MECVILGEIKHSIFLIQKESKMKSLSIAIICHGINAAYCKSLGDDSQLMWEDAPQWQKDSAIAGVEMHLANPNATPEDSHKSWFKQKELEGWKYGAVKDAELKEHPCFLPYEELPQEQKAKDYLFRAVVHLVKEFPDTADHHELLTQLVTAQTQIKQYQNTLAAHSDNSAVTTAQGISIIYESFKPEHTDKIYGSNVRFFRGQPKTVPLWLAEKLLKHPEFKKHSAEGLSVDAEGAYLKDGANVQPSNETTKIIEKAQVETKEKEREENSVFDAKQVVSQINDKESLSEYAMKTFNQKIAKNQSIEWMKEKINELIDQQGLPK